MLFNPCPCCSMGVIELSSSSIISGINGISFRLCNSNFKFDFSYFLYYYQNIELILLEFF